MEKIICDTNIWYDIANGKIKLEEISKIKLIGTAVNIIEIASTPNLVNNIELVNKTIKAVQENHFILITTNPFDHLISIFDSSFIPEDEHVIKLLYDFELLKNINTIKDLSIIDWEHVKNKINKINLKKEYITEIVNEILSRTQILIKENHLKKSYSSISYKDSWKSFFIILISEYYKYKYKENFTISENDENWNRIDFFITAWSEYFKCLDIKHGRKFKNNDWHDLFNLVYVQPEFKYWTNEKRSWAKLLNENENLKPYIFNP